MEKPSIKVITMESLHSFDQIISNQRFFLEKVKNLKEKMRKSRNVFVGDVDHS